MKKKPQNQTMSKTAEVTTERANKPEAKEMYGVCKQNINKYFEESEKNITQYMQSISNLQQECVTAFKNAVESTIEYQQDIVTKSGLASNLPQSYVKAINDATDEFLKNSSVQSKTILAAMDIARQNIKTFNDNLKALGTMDSNILQAWFSAWKPMHTS
jgi:tRNA U34 5-carboxymethylaminomethyl modifying GTPase MnmE/TrmE